MKSIITILFTMYACTVFGQKVPELMKSGYSKYDQNNFVGAKNDYSRAIRRDDGFAAAYFNRGLSCLALGELHPALKDFNKTIELDAKYVEAYFYKAMVLTKQNKYQEALPVLDITIKQEPSYKEALILRGQLRVLLGNRTGGCEDFANAKYYGSTEAAAFREKLCALESLKLDWPANEKWKVGSTQDNLKMTVLQLVKEPETLENWTESGFMSTIKGATGVPVDKAMYMMFEQARKRSSEAKLTFIEKDEQAEHPWIIFVIEAPGFQNDSRPESQLWYVVQGKSALYTNFRAVRQATVPEELKQKWIAFLRQEKLSINKRVF